MDGQSERRTGFEYRTVLGAWINDLSSTPRLEQWPSMQFDAALERDLVGFLDTMHEAGLDSIVLFGLLTPLNWKPRFKESVPPDRAQAVRRFLGEAKRRDIKVLYGLGLYSWGFDEIIKSDPDVRGTNPHAMCPSKPASHETMERIVDYLVAEFPFDGFHLESADLGRCACDACRPKSDAEYHIELNERIARYIRTHRPDVLIEVYYPIGKDTLDDCLRWAGASEHFSFIIDDQDRPNSFGCTSRRDVIDALRCAYGTRGCTYVYPPQRWDRLRWFIPIIGKHADHYRKLRADGGRAIMIQGAPLVNPAEETTLRCSAKLALDPFRDVGAVIVETVEEMFRPRTRAAAQEVADILWSAERAYWSSANFPTEGSELYIEPLFGTIAGPPIYLQTRMHKHDIQNYRRAVLGIRKRFCAVEEDLDDTARARRIVTCLDAVLDDIATVLKNDALLRYPVSTTGPDTWTEETLWSF